MGNHEISPEAREIAMQILLDEGYSESDIIEDEQGEFVWSREDEEGKMVKRYLYEISIRQ